MKKGLAALALALAVAAAGCGDGGDEASAPTTTETTPTARQYPTDAEARKTLDAFVEAAGRRDAGAMYELLSEKSQAKFGPTLAAFESGAGRDLGIVLGAMARKGGGYEHVLAKRVSDAWSVAAIQGFVTAEGDRQYGAYAAALHREGGKPRIELSAPLSFNPVAPDPELQADSKPDIATEVTADEPILHSIVWVDDRAEPSNLGPEEVILSAEVASPLAAGRHTVVTYAETQSGAGANAYSFEVG